MNRDGAFLGFSRGQELIYDVVWWCRAIQEVQIQMFDSMFRELLLVVLRFVEAHDKGNTHFLENLNVILGRERAVFVCLIQGSRERDVLAWHRPVEIAILHLLVVLILDDIELAVVVPAQLDGQVQSIEAVVDSALVGACAHRRIAERRELMVVRLEDLPRVLRRALQNDDHECAHEEGGVRLLRIVERRVMIDLVRAILLVIDELLELLAE